MGKIFILCLSTIVFFYLNITNSEETKADLLSFYLKNTIMQGRRTPPTLGQIQKFADVQLQIFFFPQNGQKTFFDHF